MMESIDENSVMLKNNRPRIRQTGLMPTTGPWNLAALSRPPAFEWGEGEQVRSLFYEGEPYRGEPTRVFACYATPGSLAGDRSKDRNLPAVVLVHGGGGTAFPEWARLWASRGYAAIAMDLSVGGPAHQKILTDGGPIQTDEAIFAVGESPADRWSYHAVADVLRAHSLIRSFTEVDPTRTAITGISWGGYLTCIAAGIDNRFKAAVPVYGCGFLHENSAWLERFAHMPPEDKAAWIRLWDPSMYVGSATMPMLFVNGGTDFAYPPDSHARTYALVRSPKQLHFVPHLEHGHYFDKPSAIEVFIEHHLNGGPPLPMVGAVHVGKEHATAPVESETGLRQAELCYTLDPLQGNAESRKWHRAPAQITGDGIVSPLPPAAATAWFLTVTDERDALVSSTLVLAGEAKE